MMWRDDQSVPPLLLRLGIPQPHPVPPVPVIVTDWPVDQEIGFTTDTDPSGW